MIEYLRGLLLERSDGHVVIDVAGVGYGLSVPAGTAARLGDPGAEAALWVRTYVREDTLRLFGFATRHEREVFDVFLSLSGVGPSIGLAVLSQMSIAEIVQATLAGDSARFRKVKGVGPKLAERLILELKSRKDRLIAGLTPEELHGAPGKGSGAGDDADALAALTAGLSALPTEAARDAAAALEALDVRPAQARRAVALALEALGPEATPEALVREGLKHRRAM